MDFETAVVTLLVLDLLDDAGRREVLSQLNNDELDSLLALTFALEEQHSLAA